MLYMPATSTTGATCHCYSRLKIACNGLPPHYNCNVSYHALPKLLPTTSLNSLQSGYNFKQLLTKDTTVYLH